MKWRKKILYILIPLIAILGFGISMMLFQPSFTDTVHFTVHFGKTNTKTISLWDDGKGTLYAFLPAGVALDETTAQLGGTIWLDDIKIKDGDSLADVELDREYTCRQFGGFLLSKRIVFMQASNVATIFIDTASGSMQYLYQDKNNEESGYITIFDPEGSPEYDGELISIEGRGNTSWNIEKKPFNIELNKSSILGLRKNSKYTLLNNKSDITNMRNWLAYSIAQDCGLEYAVGAVMVNVYFNGEYGGLYTLTEKVSSDFKKQNPDSILIERQWLPYFEEKQRRGFVSSLGDAIAMRSPKDLPDSEIAQIEQMYSDFIEALVSEDGINDKGQHYTDYIDMVSFAKYYIIQEALINQDGLGGSIFFYLQKEESGDKFYAGPVWDFDTSLGDGFAFSKQTRGLYIFAGHDRELSQGVAYYLYQHEEFIDIVKQVYQECMAGILSRYSGNDLPEQISKTQASILMDCLRRGQSEKKTNETLTFLQQFLIDRLSYVDEIWNDAQEGNYRVLLHFNQATSNGSNKDRRLLYIVPEGIAFWLPDIKLDQEILGWTVDDTDTRYQDGSILNKDTDLFLVHTPKESTTTANRLSWKSYVKLIIRYSPLILVAILGVIIVMKFGRKRK